MPIYAGCPDLTSGSPPPPLPWPRPAWPPPRRPLLPRCPGPAAGSAPRCCPPWPRAACRDASCCSGPGWTATGATGCCAVWPPTGCWPGRSCRPGRTSRPGTCTGSPCTARWRPDLKHMHAGEDIEVRVAASRAGSLPQLARVTAEFWSPGRDPEHDPAERQRPDHSSPCSFDPRLLRWTAVVGTSGWAPGTWTVRGRADDGGAFGWAWSSFRLAPLRLRFARDKSTFGLQRAREAPSPVDPTAGVPGPRASASCRRRFCFPQTCQRPGLSGGPAGPRFLLMRALPHLAR